MPEELNLHEKIKQAALRIRPHVFATPLLHSTYLSTPGGGSVYFKLESEQVTGSFKARGAANKVLALSPQEKSPGLVTASSGNHALGFARALSVSGDSGRIFLPTTADPVKVEALKPYGVTLAFHGSDCLETELYARGFAREQGMVWVSPYNDPLVIAGQGTVGKEILDRLPDVDVVLATVGGGGLISGVAAWMKAERPDIEIVGCLPKNSPEMYLSVLKGEAVSLEDPGETLSDGSAGGLEPGAITLDLCTRLVDDYLLVSEAEIADAIRWMVEHHHKIIEGAAGVALGAYMKNTPRFEGKKVAIVICGANISTKTLKHLL